MIPAILPGDKVIVNKLIPGPRIIRNFFSLHKGEKPDITRLKGTRAIQRNDILIFNFPYSDRDRLEMDMNVFYAKRCVAIPGDTFMIENGIYKVKNSPDTLGYYPYQRDNYIRFAQDTNRIVDECFPFDKEYNWTVLNFGPLYVPQKGDNLTINAHNIKLYRNLITYETGREITLRNRQGNYIAERHGLFVRHSFVCLYFPAKLLFYDRRLCFRFARFSLLGFIARRAYCWESGYHLEVERHEYKEISLGTLFKDNKLSTGYAIPFVFGCEVSSSGKCTWNASVTVNF
jgi:signal peptidase I